MVTEGETAEVGTPIGIVAANEDELKQIQRAGVTAAASLASQPEKVVVPAREAPAAVVSGGTDTNGSGRIKASPLAKRVAEERGRRSSTGQRNRSRGPDHSGRRRKIRAATTAGPNGRRRLPRRKRRHRR